MTRKSSPQLYTWRYVFVGLCLGAALVGLIWRMVDLTIVDSEFLQRQGDARTIRILKTPAYRGMITDRNGEPLAISTPVDSVWINPQDFKDTNKTLHTLANQLNLSVAAIAARIKHASKREFVYIKRGVNPELGNTIKKLKLPGVYIQREFRRFYPEGEVMAHVLGFTNIDDRGQEGIELAYEDWLKGRAGKKRVLKDRLGHIIADVETVQQPMPGNNLTLSIDRRIQYAAYRELKNAVEKNKAKSGTVIVLDVKTGEVLAMVNQPSYNPNSSHRSHDGRLRNRAITDTFEPGSVIKAFSLASALESGKYTPDSLIDTKPSWLMVDGNTIKDDHDNGIITVTQVLKRSSNVGVTKMILSLPAAHLVNLLRGVGFGQRTGVGFPGESAGVLYERSRWRPFVLATLGFGYGLSVTPLQLAHAYSVFSGHGRLLPVSLLRVNDIPKGRQVISEKTADQIFAMLTAVVEEGGTGRHARIPGFKVAGKTGTARMVGPNGYEKDHHVATFIGIAPVRDPRLLALVVINDPRGGKYYGGTIAAPVFSKVMAESLRMLNIYPTPST